MVLLAGLIWAYLGANTTKSTSESIAPASVESLTVTNTQLNNLRSTQLAEDTALYNNQNNIELTEIKPANKIDKEPVQELAHLNDANKAVLATESTLNDIVSSENGEILS